MTTAVDKQATSVNSLRLVLTLAVAGLISGVAIIAPPPPGAILRSPARGAPMSIHKVYTRLGDDGEFIGYAIPGAGPGFQDTIGLLYGYAPAEKLVRGMEILESRETPGLGDKIYKDADFVSNFSALLIEPEIVAVKKNTKTQPNEIDAITGATISSKAVVRIINETHVRWAERLPPPGSEPPLETTRASGDGDVQ